MEALLRGFCTITMVFCCAMPSFAQTESLISKMEELKILEERLDSATTDISRYSLNRNLFYVYINDDLDKAIELLNTSLSLALEMDRPGSIGYTYADLGNATFKKGDYTAAFEYFESARNFAKIADNPEAVSGFIDFYEGIAYMEIGFYEIGVELLESAEKRFSNNSRNQWQAQYELTKHLIRTEFMNEAIENIQLLDLSIPEDTGNVNTAYLYHYVVLSELYVMVKEFEKAKEILDRVWPYLLRVNRNYYTGIANLMYSKIYFQEYELGAAVDYGEKALANFEEQLENTYSMQADLHMAELYATIGDFEIAYLYFEDHLERLSNLREAQQQAIENQLQFETNEAQDANLELEKNIRELQTRRILETIMVILFLILLLISYLLWNTTQKVRASANTLEIYNREKNHFIGVVSHDLRGPLNSIMVLSEFMRDEPELMDESTSVEYGGIIYNSSLQMKHLLNNMLDINKIESNQNGIDITELDLLPIIKQQYNLNAIIGKDKEINTSLVIPEVLPKVLGNENAIIRVVDNLVSNAYKFSDPKSTVTISVREIGSQIEISIADEGPGLTELDKTKLFQKFEKLSATPTANEKSTGLGLFIVKNLVKEMDGTILIESEPEKGTTFKVLLNIA